MRPSVLLLLFSFALLPMQACARSEPPPAKTAILFIGDGVDDHQLTLGRNYLHGASGTLLFEGLERRATARVLTVKEDNPRQPEYVADSASGGTALSAGVVTSRVEEFARKRGYPAVDLEVMAEVRRSMPVDFSKKLPFFLRSADGKASQSEAPDV